MTPMLGIMASSISGSKISTSSFESIATATFTGTTTVSFTSIPSTFKSLQIRMTLLTTAFYTPAVNFNGTLGGTDYAWHEVYARNGTISGVGYLNQPSFYLGYGANTVASPYPSVYILDVIDYTSTTKYKTTRSFFGGNNNGNTVYSGIALNSGVWLNTAAVTQIDISAFGTAGSGSSIALYGIK